MNKKISLGAAIAFMLIVAAATFSMSMLYAMSTFNEKVYSVKERESTYSKIAEIDSYVRQNYIGSIPKRVSPMQPRRASSQVPGTHTQNIMMRRAMPVCSMTTQTNRYRSAL